MKTHAFRRLLLTAALLLLPLLQSSAQRSLPGSVQRPLPFNQDNPARISFQLANWNVRVPDRAKLIEIGPIVDDRRNSLLFLIGGTDRNDYRRKLLVTHWDGFQLATDTSLDFIGWAVDPLLIGRFRIPSASASPNGTAAPGASTTPTKPNVPAATAARGKRPPSPPSRQVLVAGGLYTVNGGTFVTLSAAPPTLKLALCLTAGADQMVTGYGDTAAFYEMGDKEVRPSSFALSPDDDGYPHWGIGTQHFDDMKEYLPGIRYAQTYWVGRFHWQICLVKGKPLDMKDNPDATTEDRLAVYIPKVENRNKTCWQMTRPEDYEETWRSGPIPGRVLDVRVGDATDTGQIGILVLTSENNDRERHLYYYLPLAPGSRGNSAPGFGR